MPFVYLYKTSSCLQEFMILHVKYIIIYKLDGKGKFNCSLDIVVYDNSIGITIRDNCSIHHS